MNYRQRIRDLREDADKTQTQIADYLGTSQTMYARYERGANEMPIRYLVALCRYYNVSADYILGFTNTKIVLPEDFFQKRTINSQNFPITFSCNNEKIFANLLFLHSFFFIVSKHFL